MEQPHSIFFTALSIQIIKKRETWLNVPIMQLASHRVKKRSSPRWWTCPRPQLECVVNSSLKKWSVLAEETKQQLSSSHSCASSKEKLFICVLHRSSKLSDWLEGSNNYTIAGLDQYRNFGFGMIPAGIVAYILNKWPQLMKWLDDSDFTAFSVYDNDIDNRDW